jgi:hypothetical protein
MILKGGGRQAARPPRGRSRHSGRGPEASSAPPRQGSLGDCGPGAARPREVGEGAARWHPSLLKWQMIWTSRQEMQGPQRPSQCSAQHYGRTASWYSKAGHVRSWRCLLRRPASMAMPRSTWLVLTSLLGRNVKISARQLVIGMFQISKGITSS